jgi:polyhydroxybutyrate depolymerase
MPRARIVRLAAHAMCCALLAHVLACHGGTHQQSAPGAGTNGGSDTTQVSGVNAAGQTASTPANAGAPNAGGTNAAAASAGTPSAGAPSGGIGTPPSAGQAGLSGAGATAAVSGAGSGAAGASGAAGSIDVPATCPTTATLKAGNTTRSLQSGQHQRSYLVHIPASYTGASPVPLVFDFHGYSSNAQQQMGADGFRELADQENFIMVYPEGIGASWNVNGCCGQAGTEMLDEIAFVRAIMDALKRDVCVDLKRVYATGISQGGGMAHHVACLAADIFAATAPVSSDLRTDPCMPVRPITEISFRGEADTLDAYGGGHVGPPGMAGYTAIGAKPTLERWKTIDMCTGASVAMDKLCETYTTCAQGVEVSLCSIPGADHVLYTNSQNFNVAHVAWEMFKKHPR